MPSRTEPDTLQPSTGLNVRGDSGTNSGAAAAPDPLLVPYLTSRTEREADALLTRVLTQQAEPIIRGIFRRKSGLGGHAGGSGYGDSAQDHEDLFSEARALLIAKLKECRGGNGDPISNFAGYAAVTTYRVYDRHLRLRYPKRWSLKNKLRYLFTTQPGIDTWQTRDGDPQCGFTAWRTAGQAPASDLKSRALRENPEAAFRAAFGTETPAHIGPVQLVAGLLTHVGASVRLDDMVQAVAALWGVQDSAPIGSYGEDDEEDAVSRLADTRASVEDEVDRKEYLRRMWVEVRQLPNRQCAALLLNLRDPAGRGIIALFPLLGIASMRQIADAVGMTPESFAEIWADLPVEDLVIAERLGITRQQVINLRKVARERLARRLSEA